MIKITDNHSQYNKAHKPTKSPAFKGAGVGTAMNYLATNETMGATAVDFVSMVIPRTIIDYTRTPEAGNETARREIFSGLLYPAAGLFGLAAAKMIDVFNPKKKEYDVPFHKINANSDSVETLSQAMKNSLNKNGSGGKSKIMRGYIEEVLDGASGTSLDKKVNIKDNKALKNELIDDFEKLINENDSYSIDKNDKALFHRKMLKAMGTSQELSVDIKGCKRPLETNGDNLIKDIFSMGRVFTKEKVIEELKSADKITDSNFVKSLGGFAKKKMLIGLTAASLAGFTFQEINRRITKNKTGSDAFVVYDSKDSNLPPPQKDKTFGFKLMKGGAALGMAVLGVKTIGGKLKHIPRKLQFVGLVPTIPQYAVLYSATIMGRMLASSDKNELRETTTRDILGFTSWLVLGNVAAKGTAKFFEKRNPELKLLNKGKDSSKLGGFMKLMKSKLRTQEEVLYKADGVNVKDKFKTAMKKLPDTKATKLTKKTIKHLNIAQASGYLYASLLLGVLIPIINKKITDNVREKEIAKHKGDTTINFNQAQFLKDRSKSFGASNAFSNFTQ